jgi:hypothetical protein
MGQMQPGAVLGGADAKAGAPIPGQARVNHLFDPQLVFTRWFRGMYLKIP